MSTPRPTVLLDVDGTLINSYSGIIGGFLHAMDAVGQPHPDQHFLDHLPGPPMEESMQKAGLSGDLLATASTAYYRYQRDGGYTQATAYPGLEQVVHTWRERGWQVATASSKSTTGIEAALGHLGMLELFDFIGGASNPPDMSRRGKVAVLRHVLDQLNLDPTTDTVVLVGDRIHDFDGARQLGLPSIAVTWGYGNEEEYSHATAVVHRAKDLDAAVRSVLKEH